VWKWLPNQDLISSSAFFSIEKSEKKTYACKNVQSTTRFRTISGITFVKRGLYHALFEKQQPPLREQHWRNLQQTPIDKFSISWRHGPRKEGYFYKQTWQHHLKLSQVQKNVLRSVSITLQRRTATIKLQWRVTAAKRSKRCERECPRALLCDTAQRACKAKEQTLMAVRSSAH